MHVHPTNTRFRTTRVAAHSFGRILVVAVLATLLPILAVATLVAPGVADTFLAGAVTAGIVDVLRHRTRQDTARSGSALAAGSGR